MIKIIADACANHLGDRRLIEQMIKKAAETKIDIIKFQSFRANKLNKTYPNYEENYEYYKSVQLSRDDHIFILDACKKYGIEPLFTVFDLETVELLDELEINTVKIASPDADNWDLIKKCLRTFEVIFISTGMINTEQIRGLLELDSFIIMYCISKYPTKIEEIDYELMKICHGFSDHTLGITAAKKAIDLEVEYIEKHFTLGRDLPGRDQAMSATLEDFKEIIDYRDYKNKVQIYKSRWR